VCHGLASFHVGSGMPLSSCSYCDPALLRSGGGGGGSIGCVH